MKQINFISRGGAEYSAPIVDMIHVNTEKGFAASEYNETEGTEQPGVGEPEEL